MESPVDGQVFRMIMRRVPSPVTVVTADDRGDPRGITIGSFTSASLDPPLISFNVDKEAQMYDVLLDVSRFAVHVLTDRQAHLSEHFAVPDATSEQQFGSVAYQRDEYGTPILNDVLAVLHCRKYAVYEAGDHSIFVGEVQGMKEAVGGMPVLYFDRTYRSVGDEVTSNLLSPVNRVSNDAS